MTPLKARIATTSRSFLLLAVEIGLDALMGLFVFAIFLLFAWVMSLARAAGFVNAEHLEAYERAHYWLNYGLFVIVGTDLLFRVVKHMFSRGD